MGVLDNNSCEVDVIQSTLDNAHIFVNNAVAHWRNITVHDKRVFVPAARSE
jgi:hypothetical protein